mmetsp:Transcript_14730/g.27197  ORF Transcript_14730/g.27197 Transcript_14730/m.27197 type:complete len:274 (-) Transcript_14730:1180-2001(-)
MNSVRDTVPVLSLSKSFSTSATWFLLRSLKTPRLLRPSVNSAMVISPLPSESNCANALLRLVPISSAFRRIAFSFFVAESTGSYCFPMKVMNSNRDTFPSPSLSNFLARLLNSLLESLLKLPSCESPSLNSASVISPVPSLSKKPKMSSTLLPMASAFLRIFRSLSSSGDLGWRSLTNVMNSVRETMPLAFLGNLETRMVISSRRMPSKALRLLRPSSRSWAVISLSLSLSRKLKASSREVPRSSARVKRRTSLFSRRATSGTSSSSRRPEDL